MVGSVNRPTTRSQSKANASRLNSGNSDSKLAVDIASKLNNLPEKAELAREEQAKHEHKQRVSFNMRCFVTVGTTRFDSLIEAVLSEQNLLTLQALGFRELSIQPGSFDFETYAKGLNYFDEFSDRNGTFYAKAHGLNIRSKDYFPSIAQEMHYSDLIIGHAGAGTAMEALTSAKPLIIVVNNKLLNNHQIELAERLAQGEYCLIAHSPEELDASLNDPRLLNPSQFPRSTRESVFTEYIDRIMNF